MPQTGHGAAADAAAAILEEEVVEAFTCLLSSLDLPKILNILSYNK